MKLKVIRYFGEDRFEEGMNDFFINHKILNIQYYYDQSEGEYNIHYEDKKKEEVENK